MNRKKDKPTKSSKWDWEFHPEDCLHTKYLSKLIQEAKYKINPSPAFEKFIKPWVNSQKQSEWETLYMSPLMPQKITEICRKLGSKTNIEYLNNKSQSLSELEFKLYRTLPEQCDLYDRRCRCDLQKKIIYTGLEYVKNVGGTMHCDRNGNVKTCPTKSFTKLNGTKNFIQYNKSSITKLKVLSKSMKVQQEQPLRPASNHLKSEKCGLEKSNNLLDLQTRLQRSRLSQTLNPNILTETNKNFNSDSMSAQQQNDEDNLLLSTINNEKSRTIGLSKSDQETNVADFQPPNNFTEYFEGNEPSLKSWKASSDFKDKIILSLNTNNYTQIDMNTLSQYQMTNLDKNLDLYTSQNNSSLVDSFPEPRNSVFTLNGTRSNLMTHQSFQINKPENQNYISKFISKHNSTCQLVFGQKSLSKVSSDQLIFNRFDSGDNKYFESENANKGFGSRIGKDRLFYPTEVNTTKKEQQTRKLVKKKVYRKTMKKRFVNPEVEKLCERNISSITTDAEAGKNQQLISTLNGTLSKSKEKGINTLNKSSLHFDRGTENLNQLNSTLPVLKICNVLNEMQTRLKNNKHTESFKLLHCIGTINFKRDEIENESENVKSTESWMRLNQSQNKLNATKQSGDALQKEQSSFASFFEHEKLLENDIGNNTMPQPQQIKIEISEIGFNSTSNTDDEDDELPEVFRKKKIFDKPCSLSDKPPASPSIHESVLEDLQVELKSLEIYKDMDQILNSNLDLVNNL